MLNKRVNQGASVCMASRVGALDPEVSRLEREAWSGSLTTRKTDSTVAAYARSEHLPERRKMMQACRILDAWNWGEVVHCIGNT